MEVSINLQSVVDQGRLMYLMDMFKMHEGFNTDIIKPGAVLFIKMVDNNATTGLHRCRPMKIEGNIMVISSSPLEFSFQRAIDVRDSKLVVIHYYDIKAGVLEILELRELK